MADTAYTEGFKAGIAWEKAHRAEMAPVALSQREMTALYDDWSALGAAVEQKRIIKLLEEQMAPKCDSNECNCWDVTGLETAIALIKGEN